MDNRANFSRIRFIKGWYVEAAMIREGLIQSFSALASRIRKLPLEGTTDPLTGVINRRGLDAAVQKLTTTGRSKEHSSELQSLIRISYAVFFINKNNKTRDSNG